MGRKTKLGKTRKDKFYKLAKETGYRSRAAFKLIQLNRKFGFLQESQVCVDLCAAPGGWMQVAKQNMPISSIVVGVDLYPIKPVGGCIGLVGDITTDQCKTALAKELGNWKVDVVLHDGAPNVGKNWLHDAFQQITLTLSALKLATHFLRPGGWFVTKVFRSKDYNALIWVLKQLFRKVHATKPSASRKESAEIFVVCQNYVAPDKIDPRLLDPRYVFEELDMETKTKGSVLHPEKQKRIKAEGYTEKDFSLRHELPVSQFIQHPNGIVALQGVSEIVFDDDKIAQHPKTTEEIRECCRDIKVLGRKDLKALIAWWKILHKEFEEEKKPVVAEIPAEVPEISPEDQEDQEIQALEAHVAEVALEEAKDAKRRKKKANKLRSKLNEKMNLKMVLKGDEGPREEADDEVFSLRNINSAKRLEHLEDQTPDILADSDNEADSEFRPKFVRFSTENAIYDDEGNVVEGQVSDFELSSSEADSDLDQEGLGLSGDEEEAGNAEDVARAREVQAKLRATNPLLMDLDLRDKDTKRNQRVQFWFEKDNLKGLQDEEDEEFDLDRITTEFKKKGVKILGKQEELEMPLGKKAKRRAKHQVDKEDSDTSDSEDEEERGTVDPTETTPIHKVVQNVGGKAGFDVVSKEPVRKKIRLSEEELALGALLATSRRKRRDLVDAAWNRYTFGDDDLPDWFVKDEQMHMRKEAPVPKELVSEYRRRVDEINIRPIKKVMEAKARKKKRALKRLSKAKKKAEAVLENPDASSQEKIRQIRKLYKKAEDKKKEVTYVVSRKAFAGKKPRRPAGVKGPYRIVDPRQKKDKRGMAAKERRSKKRK
ncbi:pre-rRNA 2'-O-ribose RNA methyltransferase FTSJ3 [Phlebotomus papatasi]|uniref:pre-rRNA 2'-O-ribose RNA methyltransferase FTSJ3 n=1 Tax=Phlebotomus papatasi TaxID=29031 RepID=UPI0024844C51|nr:pre-rRNA 2'-O-ribose RNA methyltransferase FTSJ3 [Phlebotomus papatasi]